MDPESQVIGVYYDSEGSDSRVDKTNARALRMAAARDSSRQYRPKEDLSEWYFKSISQSDTKVPIKKSIQSDGYSLHRLYRKHRYRKCFNQAADLIDKYSMSAATGDMQEFLDIGLRAGCKVLSEDEASDEPFLDLLSRLLIHAEKLVSCSPV